MPVRLYQKGNIFLIDPVYVPKEEKTQKEEPSEQVLTTILSRPDTVITSWIDSAKQ